MKNKVIAVTGASRGLGAAFSRRLGEEGARVVLLARPSDQLDGVASAVPGSAAIHCDVGRPDEVRSAFAQIRDRFGRLDVLVNNAAVDMPSPLENMSDEDIFSDVTTNLIGPMLCIRAAIPLMRAAGGGDVVNISSIAVNRYFPYLSVYAATKGGLEKLSANLREELRKDNIRVTILRAGAVAGTSLGARWDAELKKNYYDELKTTGAMDYTGKAIEARAIADLLVNVITMPRDSAIDIVEVRGI